MDEIGVELEKTKLNTDDQMMMLKKAAFENLLQENKLSLVLDLDHTLIHTVNINNLEPKDRDLILKQTNDPKNSGSLFQVKNNGVDYVIKLRAGLRHFLEEASKLCQLHVFTMGNRVYAMEILKLIDPENHYFGCKSSSSSSSRVFTWKHCIEKKKRLDLVIGKKSEILIIDDDKTVWRDVDRENVLEIQKYDYFGLASGNFLEGSDESETEGWLNKYLDIIKVIHASFFNPEGEGDVLDRDVRVLKNKLQKDEWRKTS